MNSMNHTRPSDAAQCPAPGIAADLKAYADNELMVLRRKTVANHLRQCAACRTEIAAMTRIANDIKTADASSAPPLSPDLRQRLLERMGAEAPSIPTARTLPLWRRKPLLVFGGGAASLAAFTVIFMPSLAKIRLDEQQKTASVNKAAQAAIQHYKDYSEKFPVVAKAGEVARKPENVPETVAETSYYGDVSAVTAADGNSDAPMILATPQDFSGTSRSAPAQTEYDKLRSLDQLMTERQVHREGSVTVAVDKLEGASDKVEQMVKASGGFVASNNLATDSDGYKSADLSVRVPIEQFDDMLKRFAALGTVTAKSISGEDITERVSDATQAEQVLKDAAQTAARKLKNENGSEKEIRYREADLRRVKIEYAQTQARLGLLRKMARLSTINVSLTEKAKRAAQTPTQGGFLGDLSETNRMASAAFASAIRVPVVLIIWVLAFSPLWVPLLVFYRYASRRGALPR